jgi:OPA family glycerol-3-phosphate transporter-like MFS transporter
MKPMIESGLFSEGFAPYISTAYLITYGSGQLIFGLLSRKISPKYMLGIGLFGAGLANTLMGLNSIPFLFVILWGLNGVFNAMLWSPLLRAFAEWLPEDHRVKAGVRISISSPIGTVLSYLIPTVTLYLDPTAWRAAFLLCGGTILIYSLLWVFGCFGLRSYIDEMTVEFNATAEPEKNDGGDRRPSTLRIIWASGLLVAFMAAFFMGSLKDGVTNWLPTILAEECLLEPWLCSLLTTALPIVSFVGAYVAKFLDRKFFHNEIRTTGACFGIATLSILCAYLSLSYCGRFGGLTQGLLISFFLACLTSAIWGVNCMILTFIPYRFARLRLTSTFTGMLNCLIFLIAALGNSVYGEFRLKFGWTPTFLFWVALAVLATVLCVLLAPLFEKKCENFLKSTNKAA